MAAVCNFLLLLHLISLLIPESSRHKISNDNLCSQRATTRKLILTLLTAFISIFGIIGNAIVILAVSLHSKVRQKNRFFFLMSLALADIGVSLFMTTLKAQMFFHNGNFCMDIIACSFFQLTDTLFPVASMTHILVISVDRWIAIRLPYDYARIATGKIRKMSVACVWFYSLIWVLSGTFKWESPYSFSYAITQASERRLCYSHNRNYNIVLLICVYILPVVVTILLSCSVIREVRAHQVQKKSSREEGSHSKALKVVITVTTVFIVCWMPHCVIVALSYWWHKPLDDFLLASPNAYDLTLTLLSDILPTLNSCINPVVYCAFSRNFQVALGDLIRKYVSRAREQRYFSGMHSIPSTDYPKNKSAQRRKLRRF